MKTRRLDLTINNINFGGTLVTRNDGSRTLRIHGAQIPCCGSYIPCNRDETEELVEDNRAAFDEYAAARDITELKVR